MAKTHGRDSREDRKLCRKTRNDMMPRSFNAYAKMHRIILEDRVVEGKKIAARRSALDDLSTRV
jgi:hypothetical protein